MEEVLKGKQFKRLASGLMAAVLMTLSAFVPSISAAPAPPEIVVTERQNQGGLTTEAVGWVSISIYNGGTSTYTQMSLVVKPTDPSVTVVGAYDGTQMTPVLSSLCVTDIANNEIRCSWPSALGGAETTAPIRFVVHGSVVSTPECLAAGDDCPNISASFSSKDSTTTSGGGSGNDRDAFADRLIAIGVEDKAEDRTALVGPNTAYSLTTWRGNGQKSGIVVPPSASGYFLHLQEAIGAYTEVGLEACGDLNSGWNASIGNTIVANVNFGSPVTPYLTWSSTLILKAGSPVPTQFLHCTFDQSGAVVVNALQFADKSDYCGKGNTTTTFCIESYKANASKTQTQYMLKVRTPTNGSGRWG